MDIAIEKILYKKKCFWFKALSNSCNNLASTLFAVVLISPGLTLYSKTFSLQNIFSLIKSIILAIIFLTLSVYLDKK
jgi:hypothetical protein